MCWFEGRRGRAEPKQSVLLRIPTDDGSSRLVRGEAKDSEAHQEKLLR